MFQLPPDFEIVLTTPRRDECLESRLVLEAIGITAQVGVRDGEWLVFVYRDDVDRAVEELDDYRLERSLRTKVVRGAIPLYAGALPAVFVYAAVVMLVAVLTARWTFGLDWLAAGQMDAGRVVGGQWWRTVTALTLHLDAAHLIGNLLFGAVFGFLAGQVLGGGLAWLVIVIAGALGNFVNAWVQAPEHLSIGASTAVFAALGVIVSHALRPRGGAEEHPLRRWSPLIGGVLLLAFTGVGGERTDVAAHVTGFLAGLALGWAVCRLPHAWMASRRVQWSAAAAACGIVIVAWFVALATSG